jgi:hypothetical protein
MPKERFSLLMRSGPALALVVVLAACTPGGQFDPTEVVSGDIFNNKKRISGEREPVFPQGVPGAETGVPPDLVRGYQPPPEAPALNDNGPQATAKAAAAAEKPKPKKPRPKVAKAPAQQQPHDPAWDQPGAAQPGSAGRAPAQSSAQSPWPSPQPAAQTNWPAAPAGGQSSQAAPTAQTNWPAPPPTRQ